MAKVTISEVRQVLNEVLLNDVNLSILARKNDEELLKTDIRDELYLDSLDFEEMLCEFHQLYGTKLDGALYNQFHDRPTVENLMKMLNDC